MRAVKQRTRLSDGDGPDTVAVIPLVEMHSCDCYVG
jgi:hypothetical protein